MSAATRAAVIARLATVSLFLIAIGIGVAGYLTAVHYTHKVSLVCPDTGVINCAKVTDSVYSEVAGVPIALGGIVFFLVLIPFFLPAAWRGVHRWLRIGRLGLTAVGVLTVFWLVYVELFKVNAVCLYCTVLHGILLALFALAAIGTALLPSEEGA